MKNEWDDELENECPLCMSPLKKKRGEEEAGREKYTVTTHCGHTFHLDCLQSQKSFDMTACPMCRTDLPKGLTPAKKAMPQVPGPARYQPNPGRVAPGGAAGEEGEEGGAGEEGVELFAEVEEGRGRGGIRGGNRGGNGRSKACVIS